MYVEIEKKSSLTPVSGCVSPGLGLLCVEAVDRKLKDLIAVGEWSIPRNVHLVRLDSQNDSRTTTAIVSARVSIATSPTIAAASPLSFSNAATSKHKQLHHHRQEIRDSIASRLPVRSQATIHRRLHTAIARRLLPRNANRVTLSRCRHWANPKRSISLRV